MSISQRTDADDSQEVGHLALSLLIILLGSFVAPLLMHSATLAIPAIASDLNLSAEQISLFTLLQILGSVVFVLPAGKLADKFGRRRMFCLGLLIAGLTSAMAGLASTDWAMIASRGLSGMGGAFIFASAIALLMSVPPEEQKVRVMGIYISIAYLGVVLGPVFGGLVLEFLHWRWVFFIPSLILLTLAALGFLVLKWERYGDKATRIRLLDFSLYAASLSVIAVGVFDAGEPSGQLLLLIGLFFFIAFCWFQTKRRDPLLQVRMFAESRTFSILSSSIFLTSFGLMALPFILTLYFQYLKGLDAKTTGFIMLVQALCTAVIASKSGWLSKNFRPRYLILSGISLFVTAYWMLAFINADTSITWMVVTLTVLGIGFGLMDTQIIHTAMSSVDDKYIGSASAVINGMRTLGGFFGLSLMSYLIGKHLGNVPIVPEVYPQLGKVLDTFLLSNGVVASLTLFLLMYGVITRKR